MSHDQPDRPTVSVNTVRMANDLVRRALRNVMDVRKLNANKWAKLSGISEGTIRNFLSGRSETLTISTLDKLADAAGESFTSIMGGQPITVSSEPARVTAYARESWEKMPPLKDRFVRIPTLSNYPGWIEKFIAIAAENLPDYPAESLLVYITFPYREEDSGTASGFKTIDFNDLRFRRWRRFLLVETDTHKGPRLVVREIKFLDDKLYVRMINDRNDLLGEESLGKTIEESDLNLPGPTDAYYSFNSSHGDDFEGQCKIFGLLVAAFVIET